MEKVKNILFRVKLKGSGIVNFDDSSQRRLFWKNNGEKGGKPGLEHLLHNHDNISYAKKELYKNDDDTYGYKVKISSNCIRQNMFRHNIPSNNSAIYKDEYLLYNLLASPSMITRGYMIPDKTISLKRKSAINTTDAIQTCNALSKIELFTKSGKKNEDEDTTDNTLFHKETIGNVEYELEGNIDLDQLQFISADDLFDRKAFNPDKIALYKNMLSNKLTNFNSDLGYYKLATSDYAIGEYGLKLSNENVNELVRFIFSLLLNIEINRTKAHAKACEIEFKPVYDVLEDTFYDEEGWVAINDRKGVEGLNFDFFNFYEEINEEESLKVREKMEEALKKDKENKKEEKAKKKPTAKK